MTSLRRIDVNATSFLRHLPTGVMARSFYELRSFERRDKNENGRLASPESVLIKNYETET